MLSPAKRKKDRRRRRRQRKPCIQIVAQQVRLSFLNHSFFLRFLKANVSTYTDDNTDYSDSDVHLMAEVLLLLCAGL